MKGDVIRFERQTRIDDQTGVEVIRLSDDQGNTNHPYFTAAQVDPEGDCLLADSDRGGETQLYALSLSEGKMVQLTEDTGVQAGCLDAANHLAYYFAGHALKRVRLDTLEDEALMDVPDGFLPASLSCTADGRWPVYSPARPLR